MWQKRELQMWVDANSLGSFRLLIFYEKNYTIRHFDYDMKTELDLGIINLLHQLKTSGTILKKSNHQIIDVVTSRSLDSINYW